MEDVKEDQQIKAEKMDEICPTESNSVTDQNDEPKSELNDETLGSETLDVKLTSELEDKIIRQVEYYFGDFNLPKDGFLKEQIKLDDGWVPVSTMLTFVRLSQLTMSPELIMSALKKSSSGLMEVCESSSKIRRVTPVPEQTQEREIELKSRTVYCKGFPKDRMNIDKLLEFFKDFPTVLNVRMRYYKGKDQTNHFKGSITVTFSTKEEAAKFLALEIVKYNDYALKRQWCVDWEAEKQEEFDARNKHRRTKQETDENGNGPKTEKTDDNVAEKVVLPRGTVLKLTNIPASTDRDEIRKAFLNYPADIAHVEITPEGVAYVRLRGENDGKLVMSKIENNKISVGETAVEISVLDGEEENEYIKKTEEIINNRANSFKSYRGRGGGRGGGRGRGRGRGGRGGRGGYKGQKRTGSPNGSRGDKTSKQSRSE